MRTLFTDYSKLRFAHESSVWLEHVRGEHVCATYDICDTDIHLVFSWPCSSPVPEDLPKALGLSWHVSGALSPLSPVMLPRDEGSRLPGPPHDTSQLESVALQGATHLSGG